MYLIPLSSYSNKASRNRVLSNFPDLAILSITSARPHRLLLANAQNFPSSKTLSTLWICVGRVWVQISSQDMAMGNERRRGYNDFSLRLSLSKRWIRCVVENLSRVFLSEWSLIFLWVMGVYIVWVKDKKVTFKILQTKSFTGWPFSRDTRETNSLARLFSFQYVLLTWLFHW